MIIVDNSGDEDMENLLKGYDAKLETSKLILTPSAI